MFPANHPPRSPHHHRHRHRSSRGPSSPHSSSSTGHPKAPPSSLRQRHSQRAPLQEAEIIGQYHQPTHPLRRCVGECQINTDRLWRTMKTRRLRAMMNHGYNGTSLIIEGDDVVVAHDVCVGIIQIILPICPPLPGLFLVGEEFISYTHINLNSTSSPFCLSLPPHAHHHPPSSSVHSQVLRTKGP